MNPAIRFPTQLMAIIMLVAVSARVPAIEIDIPYTKAVLDNGLTVIVHKDNKAPVVAVNIWYHVGSKNERPGRTGFAHLFEHLMFPWKAVLELNKVPRAEASTRIDELLAAVGLADRASSYPDVLSGGEQQRVAIARALCHEPALLLADEPTGNLDDTTAEDVLALLDKLVRSTGRTLLIATHSMHVASLCDRVLELHNGRL